MNKIRRSSRLEVIQKLNLKGEKAYPLFSGWTYLKEIEKANGSLTFERLNLLPLAGISKVPTVYCKEAGEHLVYKSDDFGFHNPQGLWSEKISLMAIGDSFVQGACVPSEQNMISALRKKWPGILNLGMAGAGPLLDLAMLKEYGAFKKPEIVLWFYSEQNDLGRDLPREMENSILQHYLREPDFSQGLIDRQKEIDQTLIQIFESQIKNFTANANPAVGLNEFLGLKNIRGVIKGLIYGSHGEISWASLTKSQGLAADFEVSNLNLEAYSQILRRAQQLTQSWGGKMYFIYLPSSRRFLRDPRRAKSFKTKIIHLAQAENLPVVDVSGVFENQANPLEFFTDMGRFYGHYNEKGYQLASSTVIRGVSSLESISKVKSF